MLRLVGIVLLAGLMVQVRAFESAEECTEKVKEMLEKAKKMQGFDPMDMPEETIDMASLASIRTHSGKCKGFSAMEIFSTCTLEEDGGSKTAKFQTTVPRLECSYKTEYKAGFLTNQVPSKTEIKDLKYDFEVDLSGEKPEVTSVECTEYGATKMDGMVLNIFPSQKNMITDYVLKSILKADMNESIKEFCNSAFQEEGSE